MRNHAVITNLLYLSLLLTISTNIKEVKGWEEGEELTVHVVPHSHNDPGWWYTFENYYQKWTRGIISSVVEVLSEEPSRTFIWAEISYFQRWWVEQNEETRETVKMLIRNGQLEFVTAGWVMNDEANTHVVDIINQLTEGHEWLSSTLDTKPKYGWAIDPFGHSPTMPYVLQQMDFEAIVINRAHRELKEDFRKNKLLEFHWQGDEQSGSSSFNMLTHMLPWKLYDIPNTCGPDWDICASFDFERDGVAIPITSSNVAERSKTLVRMYKEKAKLFRHSSVLIPLGDDFKYKSADMTRRIMSQYEMLFKYINENKAELGVNIKFSTIGQYFADVKKYDEKAKSTQLPTYRGDFFTYCDEGQDYWSGYFTTRPFMKGLTRSTEAVLRNGEILSSLAQAKAVVSLQGSSDLVKNWQKILESARRDVGLFQHHDGVTGTARREVVNDYSSRLFDSLTKVAGMASNMALYLVSESQSTEELKWTIDPHSSNPLVIEVSNGGVIVIFNSLAHSRAEVVSVVVNNYNIGVVSGDGEKVEAQIDPIWDGATPSSSKFMLHFVAEVKGIGLNTYFIKPVSRQASLSSVIEYGPEPGSAKQIMPEWNYDINLLSEANELTIENSEYRIHLSGNGFINKIKRLANEDRELTSTEINQSFLSYESSGGAYLFLPRGGARTINVNTRSVRVVTGPLVSTVTAISDSTMKENVVRLYECYTKDSRTPNSLHCPQSLGVEVLHTVHLTDSNTEIVTRFSTGIATGGKFFTDSNGLDMRERHYIATHPIQGNYYPITSAAYIESSSDKVRLTALSHQAHGATSLKDGELEIMLDRRLDRDDGRGLGESIVDNVRTLIPLWLVVESTSDSNAHPALSKAASDVWYTRNYPLYTMHSQTNSPDSWAEHHKLEVAPLKTLPSELQLMSLAPRFPDTLLPSSSASPSSILRLYRPPVLSSGDETGVIDVKHMFIDYSIESLQETSLSLLNKKTTSKEFNIKPTEIVSAIFQYGGKKNSVEQINNVNQNIEVPKAKDKLEKETEEISEAKEQERIMEKLESEKEKERKEALEHERIKMEKEQRERQNTVEKERGKGSKANVKTNDPVRDFSEADNKPHRRPERGQGNKLADDIVVKKQSSPTSTSGLYVMSIVFYLTLLGVVFVGGWLIKKKRSTKHVSTASSSASSSSATAAARVPNVWKEREDSMMKLL